MVCIANFRRHPVHVALLFFFSFSVFLFFSLLNPIVSVQCAQICFSFISDIFQWVNSARLIWSCFSWTIIALDDAGFFSSLWNHAIVLAFWLRIAKYIFCSQLNDFDSTKGFTTRDIISSVTYFCLFHLLARTSCSFSTLQVIRGNELIIGHFFELNFKLQVVTKFKMLNESFDIAFEYCEFNAICFC